MGSRREKRLPTLHMAQDAALMLVVQKRLILADSDTKDVFHVSDLSVISWSVAEELLSGSLVVRKRLPEVAHWHPPFRHQIKGHLLRICMSSFSL